MITKRRWTNAELDVLKNKYLNYTSVEIANYLNRSRGSVGKRLQRLYKTEISRRTNKTLVRYSINIDKLLSEDDPNVYYLIGLIAADGNVYAHRILIKLKSSDDSMLHDLKQWAEYSGNIQIRDTNDGFCPIRTSTFTFTSPDFVHRLNDIGITPNKSLTLKINTEYFMGKRSRFIGDFIRGVFDGDGTVCRTKDNSFIMNICSKSRQFVEDLMFITNMGTIFRNKNDMFFWSIRSWERRQFYDLLYSNDCIKLGRKYKRVLEAATYKRNKDGWKKRKRNTSGQFI